METLYSKIIQTPLGDIIAVVTKDGLYSLDFIEDNRPVREENYLPDVLNMVQKGNLYLDKLEIQLDEYFSGERKQFDIELVFSGSDFKKKVLKALLDVPYGTVQSYKEQAEYAGVPKAIRAVATANANNKLMIVVPCHRIVGTDGELRGYRGGLYRKKYLIDMEAKYSAEASKA
ncbi:MAG: methylated-DNA--[protein]-cysteine S-methyltransferase [Prevotellaceae bacterium]|jgi:AraC family transcriptional regulator of adaptative response/methylated-DNA-[protein]-cysteine methyltransferase|nr:methylated-DNA--[protein]-cysteine S-methyltransferase [Prevotellaceae bacterium]